MQDFEKEIVIEHINNLFNVDITIQNRKRDYADARKMISYYLRIERGLKFQEIADLMYQVHSNVVTNKDKHINLYQTDKQYKEKYDLFIETINLK